MEKTETNNQWTLLILRSHNSPDVCGRPEKKTLNMGTEEKELEPAAQQPPKEQEEKDESPSCDTSDPLTTYKWHTGSRGDLDEVRGEASPTSTISKFQKASSNKWSKMQNWRKALSEEHPDKTPSSEKSGEGARTRGTSKNPFRRAFSEPLGPKLSTLTPSSSSAPPAPAAESAGASGLSSSAEPSQRGSGGMLFKKYLRTVSQKLKRPRLQSRWSASNLLAGTVMHSNASYSCIFKHLQLKCKVSAADLFCCHLIMSQSRGSFNTFSFAKFAVQFIDSWFGSIKTSNLASEFI